MKITEKEIKELLFNTKTMRAWITPDKKIVRYLYSEIKLGKKDPLDEEYYEIQIRKYPKNTKVSLIRLELNPYTGDDYEIDEKLICVKRAKNEETETLINYIYELIDVYKNIKP